MSDSQVKILVLAADPSSLEHLKLDEELRAIDIKVYGGKHRDRIELHPALAVRRGELLDVLNRHRPQIVHFSGHGSKASEIFLVSEDDTHVPVSVEALKAIFAAFKDTVRLVFFNACHSRPEAEAIVEEIDCAVGTNTRISDRAAMAFAASFYSAIASGRSVGNAVEQGKARLLAEGIQEENTIELLVKQGVDPYDLVLVGPEGRPLVSKPESRSSQPANDLELRDNVMNAKRIVNAIKYKEVHRK